MFYQIAACLLNLVVGLMVGACMLRSYMQWQKVPFGNAVGRMVLKATDWLVQPVQRMMPALGRWDVGSLVVIFLLELGKYLVLWMLSGAEEEALIDFPLLAIFASLRLALTALAAMLLAYAITSWLLPRTPIYWVLNRLCEPLLRKVRGLLPQLAGIDFSPLLVFVVLNMVGIALEYVQSSVLLSA